MGNGNRVGAIIGNRNRTRGVQCEVEWDRDWGLEMEIGDGKHETKQILET